jgi:hypothetical protein
MIGRLVTTDARKEAWSPAGETERYPHRFIEPQPIRFPDERETLE